MESDSVHDVAAGVLEMHKPDDSDNHITGHSLSLRKVSLVIPAKRRVRFDDEAVFMRADRGEIVSMRCFPQMIGTIC